MFPGVRPIIFLASFPTAVISPVSLFIATTEGSLTTTPFPFKKTNVLAVPKSIPKSCDNRNIDKKIFLSFPEFHVVYILTNSSLFMFSVYTSTTNSIKRHFHRMNRKMALFLNHSYLLYLKIRENDRISIECSNFNRLVTMV